MKSILSMSNSSKFNGYVSAPYMHKSPHDQGLEEFLNSSITNFFPLNSSQFMCRSSIHLHYVWSTFLFILGDAEMHDSIEIIIQKERGGRIHLLFHLTNIY